MVVRTPAGKTSPTPPLVSVWSVKAVFSLPAADHDRTHPKAYAQAREALADMRPIIQIKRPTRQLTVALAVQGRNKAEVEHDAAPYLAKLQSLLELKDGALQHVQTTHVDPSVVGSTDFPELVGVREAAEILGVSKQRVSQLSQSAGFPSPIARLHATPVWVADHLRTFAAARADHAR